MSFSQSAIDNHIFALDIGTRTVIGLVGHMEGKNFRVIAEEMVEHESRSMFDGQIHDIPQVAEVVAQVKSGLEKKTGLNLNKVAVAAAGRSLKTVRCTAELEHDANKEIELVDIRSIELAALRTAHRDLESGNIADYYCVGHCVITYLLDNMPVSNLFGHRAAKIGVEIVATFLPVSVVNSLYAVLHRVNLEPVNLTLEPIAAIDVAIPASFRLLNLALVDIGAGTSDIAITRDGSIIAYGMVPMAGDEVTEPIVEQLLVEFNEAERIKRLAGSCDEMAYTDILGATGNITKKDFLPIIEPALDRLADAISSNILDLNGGIPPKSVFCIGGGAKAPQLADKLAQKLQMDPERVVMRDRSHLRNVAFNEKSFLPGPEGVTVVGIATIALTRMGYEFMSVRVNSSEYKLFNTREINVSQALGLIRFDPRNLIGKNGKNLKFYFNGKEHLVYGELGEPARIYINNKEANLQSSVKDGDDIMVIKAVDGRDASARVSDFIPQSSEITFKLNGTDRNWRPKALLNGAEAGPNTLIKTGDSLEFNANPTVGQIAQAYNINVIDKILINGRISNAQDKISTGNNVEIISPVENITGITITVNGEKLVLNKTKAIFVDIFNLIDIDTTNPQGFLIMKLNEEQAHYTDPVQNGDSIEVFWSDQETEPF
ncbi:cell division protein FtsA [Desulfotomaculum arcticum]|uniref:Cell division protein FtsA n=1 Tax=Desulfotruncus arcticus DSM 17038 TaxID=1121424 RepID=A0A1I2QDS6_9FIRM|nr:cell division FtsA domain-containing protein [Desulfotruncus arcticus]SFG23761.1 cell division protein FtsA [Desulfotomaculum arcticum] [Desulfotruncus arcticus DSM 17038]